MANFDGGFTGRTVTLRAVITQAAQSVSGNYSEVTWALYALRGSGVTAHQSDPSDWSIQVDGQNWSGTWTYDFGSQSSILLGQGQKTIYHNPDGSRSFTVFADADDNGGLLGSATLGGTFILSTIPRASTPSFSASAVDAGEPITISTNRASTGFTHTVKYTFGSSSGTIATGVGASTSWTPPLSLLSQIPSATSGTCTITLETYSGGTLIGSKSANFTLRAGSGVLPDFTTISHAEAVAAVAAQIGGYVKGQSKLALGISGEAGAYGSTITGYQITVAGQTINAKTGTTPNVIGQAGTLTVTGKVTDSRGRTRTKTITVTVLAWAAPTITSMAARRALVDGTVDEDGTSIRVDLQAAVSSLVVSTQKNAFTYRVYTRMRGDTGAWTLAATASPSGIAFASSIVVSGYPVDTSYDVRVEVSDRFTTSAIVTVVATAEVLMHWADAGIGIGKFWEQGALDVDGDIYMSGTKVSVEGHTHAGADTAAATTSARGTVELATQAEVNAGTDNARVVTPATLRSSSNLPYSTAAGTTACAESGVTTITFPSGRFSVPPRFVATVRGNNNVCVVHVGAITTTSAQVRLFTLSGTQRDGDIDWTAVQMASGAASG